jgi:hypothetical protein
MIRDIPEVTVEFMQILQFFRRDWEFLSELIKNGKN